MANLFWVGGTADCDGTGLKWATTSGGVGSVAAPTTADVAHFDANSGAVTVTVKTAVLAAGAFDCTGFTGTIIQQTNINVGSATLGDFLFSSGMTFTWVSGAIKLSTTKASATSVNLFGKTVGNFTINANGGNIVMASDIIASAALAYSGGTIDMNGFNATCFNLSNGNTLTRSANLRGGTITITGTGAIFDAPAGILTFLWTTGAKIIIANTSVTAKTFAGGTNTTIPPIEVAGAASAGTVTFSGAFTCGGLTFDPDANVVFTAGTTTTAASLNWTGTSGHTISVKSTSAGSPATISVASGVASGDYLVLKDSTATGGAAFYAGNNSTNVSGNTGWTFTAPPITTQQTLTSVSRITVTTLKTLTSTARITAKTQKTTTSVSRLQVTSQQGNGPAGVEAYWPADEASGLTLHDAAAHGHDGTLAASGVALGGGALTFSGSGVGVTIPDSPAIDITDAITVALWAKPTGIASGQALSKNDSVATTTPYEIQFWSDGTVYANFNVNGTFFGNTHQAYAAGQWIHVAATFDKAAGQIKLYINGVLKQTVSTTVGQPLISNTKALYLGSSNGSTAFNGQIRDVRIYPRALNATEIAQVTAGLVNLTAISRIQVTTPKTETSVSRIAATTQKTIASTARIQKTQLQTIPSTARVQKTQIKTETSISRIQVTTTASSSRLWTPADGLSGGVLPQWWIDASQLHGYADGDPVSSWDDVTGNGAPATISGTTFNAPHFKTSIINGKPVIRFVASNSEALRAYPNTGAGTTDPMTSIAVGSMKGTTNARLFGGIYPLLRNWLMGWWNGFEDVFYSEGFVSSTGPTPSGAWKIYDAVLTGSFTSFYNVGNLIAANSGGFDNINNGVALSGYDATGATNELSDGDLAECLIYDSALGTSDRQKIEGYLAWKYGLQAQLPGGHPYAAAAPTVGGPLTSIARITVTTQKTVLSTARITATTTRTETSISRIQKTAQKTETSISRVQVTTPRTETSTARITATTARTLSSVSRITAKALKTLTSIARIVLTQPKTITSIARIQKSVQKTLTSISKINGITKKTITSTASILALTQQQITSKAWIGPPIAQGKYPYILLTISNTIVISTPAPTPENIVLGTTPTESVPLNTSPVSTLTSNPPSPTVL